MQEKIRKHFTLEYLSVFAILVIAFVVRVFRVNEILAFHYDQGRDALVIWDLVNAPYKFFLIGPTTGLVGIFRGPFYYYLIAPFYALGQGNPIWPSVFLAFLSVFALFLMYKLAKEIGGKTTGFIALILGAFSFEIIYASRWLSNPTPMLFLSMLLIWSLFRILDNKKWAWVLLSVVLGLSFFSFGSSGELFYFLAIPIFVLIFKKFPNVKTITLSIIAFLLTFLPLFIFNIRHGGILSNNVTNLVGSGNSFVVPTWRFVSDRLSLIFVYLSSTIFHSPYEKELLYLLFLGIIAIFFLARLLTNDKFKIVFIVLLSPIVGLLFYQGNHGNFYQYYLTGYYLVFLLGLSFVLGYLFKSSFFGKAIVIYFLFFFVTQNWSWIKPYIYATGEEKNMIVLSNQKKAIDWVYQNLPAGRQAQFNVDVYVPPVISYSYDYLFKWLGTTKYGKLSNQSQVERLYTLYEADPEHPERLNAWLSRQAGIGSIIKEQSFGGITVQERKRILYSK